MKHSVSFFYKATSARFKLPSGKTGIQIESLSAKVSTLKISEGGNL